MKRFLKRILGGRKSIKSILQGSESLETRLRRALEFYLSEISAERGCLLLEKKGGSPKIIHAGAQELAERFPFSRAVVDAVLDEGRGLYSFDSTQFSAIHGSESLAATETRSFVCAPILFGGEHLGVLYLDNPTSSGLFSAENLVDLEEFSRQIGEALLE